MPRGLAKTGMLLAALVLAIGAGALFAPSRAEAAVNSCSVSSSGVAFSPYNSQTKSAVDGTGTFTVTCSGNGASNSLSLNITGGNANSCTTRQMRTGGNNLNYQLYSDAGRATLWCDGGDRLDFNIDLSGPTGSNSVTFTVYGRVAAGQNPVYTPATYSDTLSVAVKRNGNQIVSSTFSVTGSVAPICSVSAGTLGFGSYSGSIVNATATVTVNCTNTAPYQVSLSGGSSQSGSARRMAGPLSSYLSYQLFRDSGRTLTWGDGSAQLGARQGGTGNGSAQSLTVYGRIPAGQTVAAGSYSDSVVVTVEY